MKKLVSMTLLLLASSSVVFANGSNTNGFDASNQAEFSGYQTYSQNNYSEGDHYIINDVKCPTPTLFFGGNAQRSIYKNSDPKNVSVAIGLQIPLFTGRCEDAANLEIRKMEWKLIDSQQVAIERQEMHNLEKAQVCAFMVEKGFEPPENYCQDVRRVAMNEDLESIFVK